MLNKTGLKFDVGDISESSSYNQLPLGLNDLTLIWNTDGIPIFHSSEYSVWLLKVMINELPFKEWMNRMPLWVFGLAPRSRTCNVFWYHSLSKWMSSAPMVLTGPTVMGSVMSPRHTRAVALWTQLHGACSTIKHSLMGNTAAAGVFTGTCSTAGKKAMLESMR